MEQCEEWFPPTPHLCCLPDVVAKESNTCSIFSAFQKNMFNGERVPLDTSFYTSCGSIRKKQRKVAHSNHKTSTAFPVRSVKHTTKQGEQGTTVNPNAPLFTTIPTSPAHVLFRPSSCVDLFVCELIDIQPSLSVCHGLSKNRREMGRCLTRFSRSFRTSLGH